jgi:hypothetical protein
MYRSQETLQTTVINAPWSFLQIWVNNPVPVSEKKLSQNSAVWTRHQWLTPTILPTLGGWDWEYHGSRPTSLTVFETSPHLQNNQSKTDWQCGREPTLQLQSPEFKPQPPLLQTNSAVWTREPFAIGFWSISRDSNCDAFTYMPRSDGLFRSCSISSR